MAELPTMIQDLINTYFAVGALTDEQYTELTELILELYGE